MRTPATRASWLRTAFVLVAVLPGATPAAAQEARAPAAKAEDVATVDAILHALYDVISGPTGQARDWDRFRSLFLPEGRLVATGKAADGSARYRAMTPDGYIEANAEGLVSVGFSEREVSRRLEEFGNIAHAFSTYESKLTRQGQPATQRGINSIQLFNDGRRWWILNVFWDSERPDNPIPPRYLTSGN
jgi:hypothetical protein